MGLEISAIRRAVGAFVQITANRVLGRTYVPHPRKRLFIETSSRCNLACRFCAYPKQESSGSFMSAERFVDVVDQATDMGFGIFALTPMLGEIFADPTIDEKLDYLDAHPKVESYLFYSNFVLPKEETIRSLATRPKLTEVHISLYGVNAEDFVAVTQKPAKQFDMLLHNLRLFGDLCRVGSLGEKLHFSIRTRAGIEVASLPETELTTLILELSRNFGATIHVADTFDTWGGTITEEDVTPLGISLTQGTDVYKYGACTLLFGSAQVKADGTVHACACRDVDGSLRIGDVGKTTLRRLLSGSNATYTKIIEDQEKGRFTENCRSCSFYSSIRDGRGSAYLSPTDPELITLPQALEIIKNSDKR